MANASMEAPVAPSRHNSAAWLARVERGGVFESLHRGHVAVTRPDGTVVAALGNPRALTYVRSAIKPVQAAAALRLAERCGATLPPRSIAIACASHYGTGTQQAEAARMLESAGLDADALRCPPTLPDDPATLVAQSARPSRLAHNCSGKHAAFLLAQHMSGADPDAYLDPDSLVQRAVRDEIAHATADTPLGPAVDGCGAPAWRCSVAGLGTAIARVVASDDGVYAQVRGAMAAHPDLIGGPDTVDTIMMSSRTGLIAKRGAEGVFAAGWNGPDGPLGVAVKVLDGADRAAGAVAAAVLCSLGAPVPERLLTPLKLPHDRGEATLEVTGIVQLLM